MVMGARAVRRGNWKLRQTAPSAGEKTMVELFDLAADVGEANNIAARHPDVVRELAAVSSCALFTLAPDICIATPGGFVSFAVQVG
jgi:arylsulfatase A-like enzyme